MKNQRRVEIPSGNGQEGKRFRGRFSILELINVVNVVRRFIILINVDQRVQPASSCKPTHVHVVEPKRGEEAANYGLDNRMILSLIGNHGLAR